MKGFAFASVIELMILVCCLQLSSAAPSASDTNILDYTDVFGGRTHLFLTNNECIELEEPLATATYFTLGSSLVSLYPEHGCEGAATILAHGQIYKGPTEMFSVKKASTP